MIEVGIAIVSLIVGVFAGHRRGLVLGHEKGHKEGHESGYKLGHAEGHKEGHEKGWSAREENLVILTEDTIKQGLQSARSAAIKRTEEMTQEFQKKLDAALGGSMKQLKDKIGLDFEVPVGHTDHVEDDSVNLDRKPSRL